MKLMQKSENGGREIEKTTFKQKIKGERERERERERENRKKTVRKIERFELKKRLEKGKSKGNRNIQKFGNSITLFLHFFCLLEVPKASLTGCTKWLQEKRMKRISFVRLVFALFLSFSLPPSFSPNSSSVTLTLKSKGKGERLPTRNCSHLWLELLCLFTLSILKFDRKNKRERERN